MKPSRFASIQVLRAVAALSVVFFHSSAFRLGEAGVDIFFVISGFIMGSIGVRECWREFLAKRLIRIVPLYWAVTIAMCVGASFGLYSHFTFTLPTLVKSLLFIPYYNNDGNIWPLAISGWTLNYEMFFYILFAVGLFTRRPILLPAVLMVAVVAIGWVVRPENPGLHSWTDPLLLEFTAGLLLSRAQFFRGLPLGAGLLSAGILGFAALILVDWYPTTERALLFGLPAFAMVSGAVAVERAGRWPSLKFAEMVGDSSYSLYLLHGVVVAFVHKLLGENFLSTPLIIALSIALAYASFRLFEKPVARFLGQYVPKSR